MDPPRSSPHSPAAAVAPRGPAGAECRPAGTWPAKWRTARLPGCARSPPSTKSSLWVSALRSPLKAQAASRSRYGAAVAQRSSRASAASAPPAGAGRRATAKVAILPAGPPPYTVLQALNGPPARESAPLLKAPRPRHLPLEAHSPSPHFSPGAAAAQRGAARHSVAATRFSLTLRSRAQHVLLHQAMQRVQQPCGGLRAAAAPHALPRRGLQHLQSQGATDLPRSRPRGTQKSHAKSSTEHSAAGPRAQGGMMRP